MFGIPDTRLCGTKCELLLVVLWRGDERDEGMIFWERGKVPFLSYHSPISGHPE
jgi:hypothetical protein